MSTMSEKDKGFIQGVAWAAGFAMGAHGEDTMAYEILTQPNFPASSFKHAAEYDLAMCREDERCAKFLKDVTGVN